MVPGRRVIQRAVRTWDDNTKLNSYLLKGWKVVYATRLESKHCIEYIIERYCDVDEYGNAREE